MSIRRFVSVRILIAVAIGIASIPLSIASIDSSIRLGSALLILTLTSSIWLTVSASDRVQRAWWFGFTLVVGLCMPACPMFERWIMNFAHYLQRLTQRGVISLSQRVIEPAALILILLVPLIVACSLGILAGSFNARCARGNKQQTTELAAGQRWRFTTRELLAGIAGVGLVVAALSGYSRHRNTLALERQNQFLQQFKMSFVSNDIKLLAEPTIVDQLRAFEAGNGVVQFSPPEINEFRIVAPIETNGEKRWAIWTYTVNDDDDANGLIYKFASAEAIELNQLAQLPLPAMRYLPEPTWSLVSGTPTTAGPVPTAASVTSPAIAGQPIVVTANVPVGTTCQLKVWPVTIEFATATPDASGKVQWSWTVPLETAGYSFGYELRCIQPHCGSQLTGSVRGGIDVVAPQSQ
jgi:hypothetical protein